MFYVLVVGLCHQQGLHDSVSVRVREVMSYLNGLWVGVAVVVVMVVFFGLTHFATMF